MNNVFFAPARLTKQWFNSRRNIVIVVLTLAFILGGISTRFSFYRVANAAKATGAATIVVSPTSGSYSTRNDQVPISVEGTNYTANEIITVYWNYTGPNTGTLVATTTADGSGAFTTSFLRQLAAAGTYTIAAIGQTSGSVATGTYTQYPQFYVRSQAGGPGTQITAYGNAYVANELVNIYWDYKHIKLRKLLATATSDGTGSFAVSVTVPAKAKPNPYVMAGVGQTSGYVATYSFAVYSPTLSLAPMSGSSSISLTVSAYGFVAFEKADIYWNNSPTPLLAVPTDSYGYLVPTTITVPAGTAPGSYPVTVKGETSHITATNAFTVVVPNISLSSATGPVGEQIGVNGQGFAAGETVNLLWNYTGPGTGTQVASAVAGYAGSVQCQFAVPVASNGIYTVAAIGATSSTIVQQSFTVANSLAASPSSDGPGQTLAVNGTGYQASESVQLYWDTTNSTPITTVTADTTGNINTTFAIATSLAPGAHTIIGVGMISRLSFTGSETINTNWGDFGFDNYHHGENSQEFTLGTGNVANLQLKWTATTAYGLKASPVYSNGMVYLPTLDGFLNAYNATTGTLQWQFNCKCHFRNFSSLLADPVNNTVFFGTVDYYSTVGEVDDGIPSPFYALNAQTGAIEWSDILNWNQVGFPTLALNTLYVGTSHLYHPGNVVYAIDEFTGRIQWQVMENSSVWGSIAVDPVTKVAFTGLGDPDDAIVALNALTGAFIWETTIPHYTADDDIGSGITIANNTIFADSKNGYEYALNEDTGGIIWSTLVGTPGIGNISSQAVSAQGVLYVGSWDDNLYALSITSGVVLWKAHSKARIFSSPAIANGVVYFASFDKYIYAVNASTGAILWKYNMGLSSYCSPIVVNGWLYCGSTNGNFFAFSL